MCWPMSQFELLYVYIFTIRDAGLELLPLVPKCRTLPTAQQPTSGAWCCCGGRRADKLTNKGLETFPIWRFFFFGRKLFCSSLWRCITADVPHMGFYAFSSRRLFSSKNRNAWKSDAELRRSSFPSVVEFSRGKQVDKRFKKNKTCFHTRWDLL